MEQFPDQQDVSGTFLVLEIPIIIITKSEIVDDNQTFLVSRQQEIQDGFYSNLFSVPNSHNPSIRNRAVVQYVGTDDGKGSWTCSKHRESICSDIQDASRSFTKLIQRDKDIINSSLEPQRGQGIHSIHCVRLYLSNKFYVLDHVVKRAGARITDSISYLPRAVPSWSRISSDDPPPNVNPLTSAPDIIHLDPNTECRFCKASSIEPNPFLSTDITVHPCVIYGLSSTMESKIEGKKCPTCNRWLGPECREIGIFNWDNRTLMTHQLLDDYTSCFTTSETPFTAWVTVVSRRYPPTIKFVSEKTFRTVWFSYIRLVKLEGGSMCPSCGPAPDTVIFDGVSLSFNRKHLLPTLRPPTVIHTNSIVRDQVVRRPKLQLLEDRLLRKDIRKILNGPSLISNHSHQVHVADVTLQTESLNLADESEESGSSIDPARRDRNNARRQAAILKEKQALLARVNLIPQVVQTLTHLNPGLGAVFHRVFGVHTLNARVEAPSVYKKLFIQVDKCELRDAPELTPLN